MGASTYTRVTDFSDAESSNAGGRSTVSTANLDAELDAVQVALGAHATDLDVLLRDDGYIQDDLLQGHEFSASALSFLAAYVGVNTFVWRGAWQATTDYAVGDIAYASGAGSYICVTAHTSAGAFVSTNWGLLAADAGASLIPSPAGVIDAAKMLKVDAAGTGYEFCAFVASDVVTLTGAQTLTNKTIDSPTIDSPTIDLSAVTSAGDLSIADGGTGSSSASDARTALGIKLLLQCSIAQATYAQSNTGFYVPLAEAGLLVGSATAANVGWVCPVDGTLKNLRLRCTGSGYSVNANCTLTVFINGVATSLTATLASGAAVGTEVTDLVNSVAVSAGDLLTVKMATSGASSGAFPSVLCGSFLLEY